MRSDRQVIWSAVMMLAAAGCAGAASDEAGQRVTASSLGAGTPVVLATGQEQPGNLVVDDTRVYWSRAGNAASDGSIASVPQSGGSVTVLASGQNVPFGLAVDASNVYWTNFDAGGQEGQVVSVPKTGGKTQVLADRLTAPREIFVDALDIYFLTDASLMVLSKAGGPPLAIAPATCPNTLVGDATSLYWVENCVLFPPQGIVRVSKLGGVPLFLSTAAPGALAVDATNLYFGANQSLATINKLVGGVPWPLAEGAAGPVAVDDRYIYWIASPNLQRTAKLGGATTTIATDARAQAIAVDAHNVYWLDFGITDGAVLALPKPR
jgi:hypothetical protein